MSTASSNLPIYEPQRDAPRRHAEEQRLVLHGISYTRYVAVRELLEEQGLRVAYREGVMEIMSPSVLHESFKKKIARLLELFALERGIDLFAYGAATFRSEPKERGLEPDECYFVRQDRDPLLRPYPDLAIEVIVSSGALDKLDIYDGLGVREVWIFEGTGHAIFVHRVEGGYAQAERSSVLPELEVEMLATYARYPDINVALRKYRDALRSP